MADEIIRSMLAEKAYGSVYSNQYADAQKAARANEIARRVGVAPEIVESALPDMMAEDRLRRVSAEVRRNTAYARVMANPRLAASSGDDIQLPKVAERTQQHVGLLGFGKAYLKATTAGLGRVSSGFYRLGQMGAETLDQLIPDTPMRGPLRGLNYSLKQLSGTARRAAETVEAGSESLRTQTQSRVLNDVLMGAESIPPSIAALVMAALSKNPTVAGVFMGGMTAGESYGEAREEGLDPIRAASHGAQMAVPEAGFEMIAGGRFVKSIAEGLPFLRTVGKQVGIEVLTEIPTTIAQSTIQYANIEHAKGKEIGDWAAGLPDEMLSTLIATVSSAGLMTSASYGATRGLNKVLESEADKRAVSRVDRIMEAAAQSSTRQTNPSDFEEALNQLAGDNLGENLYIPADKAQELFQDRELADDPFWGQYADQIAEADALGGDIVIPLSTAATHLAGSDDWKALREHVRTRPGGRSLAEGKDTPEDLERIAADIAKALDEQLPQFQAQNLTAGFAETLGYEGEQAEAVSRLLAAGMVRARAIENAKRQARGEEPVALNEFARNYLPQAARMTQAEFDDSRPVAAAAQSEALNQEIGRRWQGPEARRVAADSATLTGENSNSPYMVIKGANEQAATSTNEGQAQEADAGRPATESGAGGDRAAASEGSQSLAEGEQLEFFPGADFGVDPTFFGSEIEVDGVPRPTTNADGKPIAQTRQAVENFWRWFGDSKAVDGEGRPIVFYHGARAQFDMFDPDHTPTFFFAIDRSTAEGFQSQDAGQLVEAYLRIKNIDEYDAEHRMWDAVIEGEYENWQIDEARDQWVRDNMEAWEPSGRVEEPSTDAEAPRAVFRVVHPLEEEGAEFATQEEADEYLAELQDREREEEEERLRDVEFWELESEEYLTREGIDMSTDAVAEQSRHYGRDAVWIENVDEGSGSTTVVIVLGEPRNIKHTQNHGSFDADDPRFLYQSDLNDSLRLGNISIQRDDDTFMSGAIIRAFEAANFSTAVHELGHFFLEDLRRRALRGDATEQELADWQTFKDWALNDLDGLLVADDQIVPTEAHEFWARGFERYIFEGQSPSPMLRTLFARMRDFMLSLYRTVRNFNSPITPEIREVMDRLLASDEEIAARREELRLGNEALAELMSADEQLAYAALGTEAREEAREKLFESVLSTLRNERQKEAWARKREIKAEVEAEIDGQPVFQALKLLRSGLPADDGTTTRATLSREWLIDNYGEDILDELPKGVPPIVDDKHSFDAQTLAELAGFESADAMVKALQGHESQRQAMKEEGDGRSPRKALIDDTTDARYRDEVGDTFENLDEEAEAALANERQADRLSMELRALARRTGRRPTAWQAAKEWARGHVRAQIAKDAISGSAMQMYARNAAKAARQVEEALVQQDYEEAFAAKQRQVVNLALMSEAKQAKDETDKAVRRLQKIATRDTIPSVDQDYLDQAHQLLETVEMKTRPQTQLDKREAFAAWHAKQVQLGVDVTVPESYRETLGLTNWSRMSINDLLELDKAVGQVIELGRLKQTLKDGKKQRDYNEAVAEMQDAGSAQPPRTIGTTTDPSRSLSGKVRSVLRGIDAAMIKIEQITRWMDGEDRNGPWHRMIFRPMSEAQGREKDLMRAYTRDINALIEAMPKKQVKEWQRLVDTPELIIRNQNHLENGLAWRGTKDQIVMMAMNWGNLGNRQRLLDGFGWDEAALQTVFDRAMTKEDWDFVQGTWDVVDRLWPELAALERRVNGVEPEKVEAAEIQTPFGTFRGGYFPVFYDTTQSTRAELDEQDKLSPSGGWQTVTTRASSTRQRADAVKGRPLLLSFGVITRHMGEAIHDITHREAVSQVKRLLSDPRIHSLISTRLGSEYAKAAGAWLENVARPNSSFSKSNPMGVKLGRHLNQGVSLVGLGFRVTSSLVQLLGLPITAGEIGTKYLVMGMRIAASNPVRAYNEIVSRSAEMRSRFDTLDATIEDMARDVGSRRLKTIGPQGITKYAFHGIAYMDMVVTTSVWTGAFNKGLDQGMSEADATEYADSVVRMTQGTGGQKDRSGIMNEHPFLRSFWPFFSFWNAHYNMVRDIGRRARNAESLSDVAEAARRAWWVMLVPALLESLIFGDGPDGGDDEEATAGDWAAYLAKRATLYNLASIPMVGNIATAIGEGYSYRSSAYQNIGDGLRRGWEAAADVITEEDTLTGSTIKSVLTTVGLIVAKPTGQIGSTAQGLYDYARGEAEPEDAGDWYELLTKGRVSKEPTAVERLAGETS